MTDHEVTFGEELQVAEAVGVERHGIEAPADGTEVELRADEGDDDVSLGHGDLESETVVVPLLGLAVDLYRMEEVAEALDAVRQAKRQLDEARVGLEQILAYEAQRRGTKTLHFGELEVSVRGGPETTYDIEVLAQLQEVGLPEDRYNSLVKTRIEQRVDRNVLRQLLGSGNPDYAAIIRKAESVEERPYRADVKRA
jgi:hypothetical protein